MPVNFLSKNIDKQINTLYITDHIVLLSVTPKMKFKILSIMVLSSVLCGAADRNGKDEETFGHSTNSSSSAAPVIVKAEIFSLADLGDKASNISRTRECIEKYTNFVQQKINQLKTLVQPCAILAHPVERLYSLPIEETTRFIKGVRGFREFVGIELESYLALSKILPGQYYESVASIFEIKHQDRSPDTSYLDIFSTKQMSMSFNTLFVMSSMGIPSKWGTIYQNIVYKSSVLENLIQIRSYRQNLITRWQRVVSDKIPKALSIFFQNSAPILYKTVEDVSKHSKGRLAGVALYFSERTFSMMAGRKALTKGDDKDHHIERELIKRSLYPLAGNYGYLFVYTTLPPCNTDTTGCLSFYRQLAQHNPNLRMMVMFDHEYEGGFDYNSITTANFIMVNRVKEAKKLEQEESSRKSITNMALTLTRATSDQIVAALTKKKKETAIQIVEQFSDPKRKERIKKRLSEAKK